MVEVKRLKHDYERDYSFESKWKNKIKNYFPELRVEFNEDDEDFNVGKRSYFCLTFYDYFIISPTDKLIFLYDLSYYSKVYDFAERYDFETIFVDL